MLHGNDVASRPGYREALIETAIVTNAALGAHTLQAALADVPGVRAGYGVYLIDSRQVWSPRAGSPKSDGLADPPGDATQFAEFGDAVVRSQRIASLLTTR